MHSRKGRVTSGRKSGRERTWEWMEEKYKCHHELDLTEIRGIWEL